jgi:hypothetical protein
MQHVTPLWVTRVHRHYTSQLAITLLRLDEPDSADVLHEQMVAYMATVLAVALHAPHVDAPSQALDHFGRPVALHYGSAHYESVAARMLPHLDSRALEFLLRSHHATQAALARAEADLAHLAGNAPPASAGNRAVVMDARDFDGRLQELASAEVNARRARSAVWLHTLLVASVIDPLVAARWAVAAAPTNTSIVKVSAAIEARMMADRRGNIRRRGRGRGRGR